MPRKWESIWRKTASSFVFFCLGRDEANNNQWRPNLVTLSRTKSRAECPQRDGVDSCQLPIIDIAVFKTSLALMVDGKGRLPEQFLFSLLQNRNQKDRKASGCDHRISPGKAREKNQKSPCTAKHAG
jgi:hypothetical protein